jgi:hypothetical protein
MDTTLAIGVIGAGIILIAFLLNQMNIWRNDTFGYDFANLVGSLVLIYYAVLLDSIPFMILNAVWALFSLKDVLKYLIDHK